MNLFYANGTPVINSLKIQSEVPLDPRLNPETIEERDSLVTKHIAYDRMKVYVKETDSEYVYHKDENKWVILSKFEKEEKDKLENIKNYLVDTEIIYDKDNNLLYREHSYDPNTNITSLRDYSIPEATVLGDGTLYNGLLSKFYVNRLNNVTGYQIDAKITSDTETESLFLTVTKYNPDTDESVTTNLNIPLVTDDNNGLVSPEKKHWMDNADGLSNTGTTSQTWQLQKSDIDTRLDPNGGVIIKNSGGKLEVRNNQDNSYAPVTLGDIIIEGNVTQKGESFITQAETVEVRDNTILLNRGETAAGVSKGFAGIEIDRGTLPKFQILFDESDRRFKAGEEGDLWCLALRDDDADMLNGMFTSWDSSTKRLKTTNIIPSDRKLAFTDNNSYLQLTSHSFSGDALNQTLRYSNSLGGIFISAGNTNLNLDTDKTGFYFHKNILLPSTISSVSDFLFKRNDVTKLSLKDTVAQFTVPVTAITFNRASDGSEVLYHADLENTEFKNYIIIAGPNDIKLYLKSTDEDNYNLISSVDQDGNKLSNMGYYGSYWAIENNRIAVYKYDANGYPEIINQDGTSPGYLRACTSGFLPNVSGNLASGGNGYLGTSSWAFANAYIANNHSNKYYFGTNDVFLNASTTRISARTTGAAIGMNVGSLLVSNNYSDETKVPNNGIYSKGAIKSYTGFTSDFRISNLTIARTGNDVLHISSFANDPENRPGTDPISSQVINDGVALTYFWQGDFAFQLVGDIDGTGMAYRRYTPSTGASGTWKFLADTNWVSNKITSVAGNYLPLAGGTMTGSIIMSNNITIQSKDSSGNSKRLIGKGSDNVTYIGDSDGHTFLYSDAADISHIRNGTSYRIWDAFNLTSPLLYASGTAATPTTVYNRNLGVNGSQWTFLSATNAATTSIYAPTAAGTSGQVLTSTGGVPTWSNISSVGDSRYVLKSGDTMTGSLRLNGGWLAFSNNDWTNEGGVYKEVEGSLKVWRVSTDAENKPSAYGSVLQINSRSGHWNTQLWIDQTNTAENNGKLRYRSTKTYSSVEWNNWTVLATEDYVNSKAAGYLPLTGGTLTGQLIINAASNSLIINNTSSGGNESFIKVKLNGTDKAAIGFLSGSGSYIHNYESSKYLFVKSDGAYFGTPSSNVKLLTTDDNVITAVGGENYVNVSLSKAAQASAGAAKYLEWWDSTPGWYNFRTGYIIANGFIRATTSLQCDGQAILQYSHNGSYHNAINVNKSDGAGYVMIGNYTSKMRTFLLSNASDILHYRSTDGSSGTDYVMWDAYNLPNPATQNWVTSQGYYKSGSSSPLFTSGVYLAANAGTGGWARGYWIGNTNSASTSGVTFGGYGNGDTPSYAYIGVGTNLSYSAVNNLKVYTDKVTFGNKTLATVDQIPTIPSISITTSGSGSVVTGISASGHTLTVTKGSASVSVSWNDITGKPSSFTPSAHTHEYIVGRYTGSGGVIAPGSIGTYKLQCNMMYTNAESSGGGYCDWILMNAYSWSDVPYATAIGVVKAATPSAYIMSGPNSTDKSTWVRKKLATTDEIPTRTSDLTNNSGFLTSSSLSGYATQSWANGRFLPLSGGKLTGDLSFQEASGIILRPSNDSYISGIFADTQGNECVAVWAKNTVTRLRWHAGVDMSDGTANLMMGIIPDFEITKASGTAIGYIAGNEILHSNNYTSYTVTKTGGGASGTWGINISGNATTATTASKLGSSTVGGTAKPIYLSAGTATACSATVGSSTVPVYMNAGTITQCSTTLGVSITGNAATSTTATKWNGYDIWVGTESQLPSSRSSTTIYIVTDA
jgi:hypothetical protein